MQSTSTITDKPADSEMPIDGSIETLILEVFPEPLDDLTAILRDPARWGELWESFVFD
jgi:hypothetical protein